MSEKEILRKFEVKAIAVVLVLLGSVGFVFDFLLRAKEYPQLALVMLGMIGVMVGVTCLIAAVYMAFLLKVSLDENDVSSDNRGAFAKWVRYFFRYVVIVVSFGLMAIGYFTWDAAFQNFGGDLKALRIHIEKQILDEEAS